jgi:protein-tyrosine phosphatase
MMNIILFLCTGNYYRSRFAEIFFNHIASEKQLEWLADSCGLGIDNLVNSGPISSHALDELAKRGITPTTGITRYPRQLQFDDLTNADLVVALKEAEHRPLLEKNFPQWRGLVTYWHVHDLDGATPLHAMLQIEHEINNLINTLCIHNGQYA